VEVHVFVVVVVVAAAAGGYEGRGWRVLLGR
jgi:hypothetical protein